MVVPTSKKDRSTAVQTQSSYYLLLAVKILLVLLILFMLPRFVTSSSRERRKRSELQLRSIRWDCQNENSECALQIPEESLNCVNQCISPVCYTEIYAEMPLEDGEVDLVRAKKFESCVHEELRVLRRQLKEGKK
jgi:hypothetical protein